MKGCINELLLMNSSQTDLSDNFFLHYFYQSSCVIQTIGFRAPAPYTPGVHLDPAALQCLPVCLLGA